MKILIGTVLLASAIAVQTAYGQVSFSIQIGGPPAPPVFVGPHPPQPSRGYVWVDGYWTAHPRSHYTWVDGYWAVPPYVGARWVSPRYYNNRYYYGYWDGDRNRRHYDYRNHGQDGKRDDRHRGH